MAAPGACSDAPSKSVAVIHGRPRQAAQAVGKARVNEMNPQSRRPRGLKRSSPRVYPSARRVEASLPRNSAWRRIRWLNPLVLIIQLPDAWLPTRVFSPISRSPPQGLSLPTPRGRRRRAPCARYRDRGTATDPVRHRTEPSGDAGDCPRSRAARASSACSPPRTTASGCRSPRLRRPATQRRRLSGGYPSRRSSFIASRRSR